MEREKRIRLDIPVEQADPRVGLTLQEARQRLSGGWGNDAPESASKTDKEIILGHCITFFNIVFLILGLVLLLSGSSPLNMTFLVVVIINTAIGIFQEIRAKRAVEKLTLVAAAKLRCIRQNRMEMILSTELVRDDIVEFRSGDQICADAILRTGELQVNESLITGEADAVRKQPGDELKSGSFVVAGVGRAQLTKVGADSFAARLSAEAKANPQAKKSGMTRSLDQLIRVVGFALIPVGLALFYQHLKVLDLPLRASSEGTVAALVGMIPEGLYLLTSVALAASALKLSRKKVLVRDMNCIETLARVDVLCVDKTGTITEPQMQVEQVIPLSRHRHEELETLLSAFYDDIEPENDTARAMADNFACGVGVACTRRIPFTSQTKWSAAEFGKYGSVVIGAPEFVLGSRFREVEADTGEWTKLGYRVLLVAKYDGFPDYDRLDTDRLIPMALVTITSRIREDAQETFRYFAQQGVAIKVISGDNPATVADVARRAGIVGADAYIDATELETEKDLCKAVERYTVFGRVTPDQKKKLVQALKKQGHTVAMTGDGVNDVLAMKEADVGIAMASGAQAASQVSQMVLLNNDFASMPGIVAEGRRVINNIQRSAALFLVKNIFSFFTSILSIFTTLPYPLIPLHLTVISTTTIGIPSFFLAMEPNYERIRGRFLPGAFRRAFPGGLTNIFVVMAAMLFMSYFGVSANETSTICTAILAVVGLLVLLEISKPMDTWRRIVWFSMATLLVLCFTVAPSFFQLYLASRHGILVLTTLLIMTPTVFFALQWLFDLGDRLVAKCRKRPQEEE